MIDPRSKQGVWEFMLWPLLGVSLAACLLFLMVGGGFILMALMLGAIALGASVAGVWQVTRLPRRWLGPVPAAAEHAPGLVVAKLVSASGACARGVQYRVGAAYVYANGRPSPAMCGPAVHVLQPVVQHVRESGESANVEMKCPLSGNIIVFQVFPKTTAEVKRAA
ncbi:MAG: hypothetical protein HY680_08575 [Chloroflexi bacterium]|nr:hypothetical protein [Chloroflexota bacterium]